MNFCESAETCPRGNDYFKKCPCGRPGEVAKIVALKTNCPGMDLLILPLAFEIYKKRVKDGDSAWSSDAQKAKDVEVAKLPIVKQMTIATCEELEKREK